MRSKSTETTKRPWADSAAPWKPRGYQKQALRFLLERPGAGLLADPGLGKTSISLFAFLALRDQRRVRQMLVVAPLRVCELVWPDEVTKWSQLNGLRTRFLHGARRDEMLDEKNVDIFLVNPEGLEWLCQTKNLKRLHAEILCVDESTYFRNTKSKRFKLLAKIMDYMKFKRRWILTGSVTANGYMGLFGQAFIVDERIFGPYITAFRQQYFISYGYMNYEFKLAPNAEKAIQQKIAPYMLRLGDDLLDEMPAQVNTTISVKLPPEAQKIYDEMESSLVSSILNMELRATNASAASGKCRQIASGGLYLEEPPDEARGQREWIQIHNTKVAAVSEILDDLDGQPCLIAYEFKHDLEQLRDLLGADVPYIGAGITGDTLRGVEQRWNAGEIPVLLGHPQAMGHGLNLQGGGHHIIWYSPTWNYELYDQFNRRVRRSGLKHKRVYVYHIVAKNTIDEIVMFALRHKAKTQNSFYAALKDYAKSKQPGRQMKLFS